MILTTLILTTCSATHALPASKKPQSSSTSSKSLVSPAESEELMRAVSRGLTRVAIPLRHTVLIYASAHISAFQHSTVTSVWKSKASQGKSFFLLRQIILH
jgi:hypothetical protein